MARNTSVTLGDHFSHFVDEQIKDGRFSSVSEVVRAGIRLLMERDGARQFYALKADLDEAVREAEAGEFEQFDPKAYEPDFSPP